MTCQDATEMLRTHTRRLAATVGALDPPGSAVAVAPCVDGRGGLSEELLATLIAHNQALDSLDSVVGPLRGWPAPPPGPVSEALEGAYRASDAAHEAVREALASVRDAARLQRDAVRVAHLAVMIACEVVPRA